MIQKILNKSLRVANEVFSETTFGKYVASSVQGNFVLMYHGVSTENSNPFNGRHVSVRCFEKQLRFLKRYMHVIPVEQFFNGQFLPGKPNIALTFDDGYLNNFTNALPLLDKYACPATFYVTGLNEIGDRILWPDFLNIASVLTESDITIRGERFVNKQKIYRSAETGESLYDIIKNKRAGYDYKKDMMAAFDGLVDFFDDDKFNQYWQLMSDRQIAEVSNSKYVKIGCHGYYHNNLGVIELANAKEEIALSKKYLMRVTGKEIKEIAYPDGSYSPQVVAAAAEMGFTSQFTTEEYCYNEAPDYPYIKTRRGLYNIDSCINQILNALK
jgi:peptidoglycan/xylan/chitin deacetylase (PgdA/CDA1 family)